MENKNITQSKGIDLEKLPHKKVTISLVYFFTILGMILAASGFGIKEYYGIQNQISDIKNDLSYKSQDFKKEIIRLQSDIKENLKMTESEKIAVLIKNIKDCESVNNYSKQLKAIASVYNCME